MLVLTRKPGERVVIDNHIIIEVLGIKGNRVRLGIEAPPGVNILRDELRTLGLDVEVETNLDLEQARTP